VTRLKMDVLTDVGAGFLAKFLTFLTMRRHGDRMSRYCYAEDLDWDNVNRLSQSRTALSRRS
jgi:hypothetical protein